MVSSAPGKVILFGEHAVVYGKTAVGAAVSDLRIVVTAVRVLVFVDAHVVGGEGEGEGGGSVCTLPCCGRW